MAYFVPISVQPVSKPFFHGISVCISRRFQVAAAVLKLVVACLFAMCVGCSAPSNADPAIPEAVRKEAFPEGKVRDLLAVRSKTYEQLNKAIMALPNGSELVMPGPHGINENETHDETVARYREQLETGRGWILEGGRDNLFSTKGFQLVLAVDGEKLPKGNNTDNMVATVFLKHFFGGLPELGYQAGGTPFVIGDVQHIRRKWFWGPNREIIVNGSVFVAPSCSRAIVICEMRTRFPDGIH